MEDLSANQKTLETTRFMLDLLIMSFLLTFSYLSAKPRAASVMLVFLLLVLLPGLSLCLGPANKAQIRRNWEAAVLKLLMFLPLGTKVKALGLVNRHM
jgi:hypothetical protein